MNRSLKFGIGACLLVGAIGYLMFAGVQTSSTYYFTVAEFLPRRHELGGEGVRVAGRVTAGSLQKQTSAKGTAMTFAIGDFAGPGREPVEGTVAVAYTGVVPDMFAEGRDVIIEGRYVDGVLQAHAVMTSCPSKYEPKPGDAAQAAAR
ncbi:MAG: cytochrome c maturation protein CcmE [Candidatus Binatia bacterium]